MMMAWVELGKVEDGVLSVPFWVALVLALGWLTSRK